MSVIYLLINMRKMSILKSVSGTCSVIQSCSNTSNFLGNYVCRYLELIPQKVCWVVGPLFKVPLVVAMTMCDRSERDKGHFARLFSLVTVILWKRS